MLKVMTVVGTRPELIRLSQTIKAFDRFFQHILVHTGQNYDYELNGAFFESLDIRQPNYSINLDPTASEISKIGMMLCNVDSLLEKEQPDAFFILGDTNSALTAISAKKRNIPIFHWEAGNRSFDQRVPEETNRKIIDHISDINLTYTQIAKENLIQEGMSSEKVHCIGSPLNEVINAIQHLLDESQILSRLGVQTQEYIIVSTHRAENLSNPENYKKFIQNLQNMENSLGKKIILSCHPRTQAYLEQNNIEFPVSWDIQKPFNYIDYLTLQKNAYCTLSDSGTISEESNILKFPAVNLRETTERQEIFEVNGIIMTPLNHFNLSEVVRITRACFDKDGTTHPEYNKLKPSMNVVAIISSYVNYINRKQYYRCD